MQLKEISARRVLESHTLPWSDGGYRVCPASRISVEQDLFASLVHNFLQDYPMLRSAALHALGALADPADYPTPYAMQLKFSMRLNVSSVAETSSDYLRTQFDDEQARQTKSALVAARDAIDNIIKHSD